MRAKNVHTARVCGIAPGSVGEVDDERPGVALFLRVGMLKALEPVAAAPEVDGDEPPAPPAKPARAPKAKLAAAEG